MGCDIHFYVERYSRDTNYLGPKDVSEIREEKIDSIIDSYEIKEKWIPCDKFFFVDDYWAIKWEDQFYSVRNYKLFEKLAGVRGLGSESISRPKGVPKDASFAYKSIAESNGDGHSHSYFTLEELMKEDFSSEHVSRFKDTIDRMKELDPDPKKVRCCFFFDN